MVSRPSPDVMLVSLFWEAFPGSAQLTRSNTMRTHKTRSGKSWASSRVLAVPMCSDAKHCLTMALRFGMCSRALSDPEAWMPIFAEAAKRLMISTTFF
jgi:hypothetical protein